MIILSCRRAILKSVINNEEIREVIYCNNFIVFFVKFYIEGDITLINKYLIQTNKFPSEFLITLASIHKTTLSKTFTLHEYHVDEKSHLQIPSNSLTTYSQHYQVNLPSNIFLHLSFPIDKKSIQMSIH